MKTAICTISTVSHMFKTNALYSSLVEYGSAEFHCLVTDGVLEKENYDFEVTFIKDLSSPESEFLTRKYEGDKLRWASKPLFILWLLSSGYDKVIYVDNDIHFFSSPGFLFDLLDSHGMILTPHNYLSDPTDKQFWLEACFRIGLFNAGFVGVSQLGIKGVQWWLDCCSYNVKKSSWRGLFDDQRYLDLMPIKFDNVHIIRHGGCNVANWNILTQKRTKTGEGNVVLNEKWPLVFVHFTKGTLRSIESGSDPELEDCLKLYERNLRVGKQDFKVTQLTQYTTGEILNFLRHLAWLGVRIAEK